MRRWAIRGQQWCERVGRSERRAVEREIGCQMCRDEDRKSVTTDGERTETRRSGVVGDEGKAQADKMNWS